MELAAEQGAEHLLAEVDKRLATIQASRSQVSWRQRPAFVRELDALRGLIFGRLAELDRPAALDRGFIFLDLARRVRTRVKDREGALAEVFRRAAEDLGALVGPGDPSLVGPLAEAVAQDPAAWAEWLEPLLAVASRDFADGLLHRLVAQAGPAPGLTSAIRRVADAAGEVDAYRATYSAEALKTPDVGSEVARRLLAAGRIAEAGQVLEASRPPPGKRPRTWGQAAEQAAFAWEGAWIEYLEQTGQTDAAQAVRWTSFERTLSVERARDFITRLSGFADVEAEERAFAHAAAHPEFERGLAFLMSWPALREAAQMIQRRPEEAAVDAERAELWAGRLRARYPAASERLLRSAAAAAFQRRDFGAADRLTAEADAIEV